MKDTIVMCPTLQRATIEWDHFCYVYRSMIQRTDRNQLKIVLLGGATLYFKAETEGQRAVRGFHADICSIDEFIGKVEEDAEEEMNQPKYFYKCDPMLNKECKKTSCQNECTFTTKKEYSKDGKKYIINNCEFVECKD